MRRASLALSLCYFACAGGSRAAVPSTDDGLRLIPRPLEVRRVPNCGIEAGALLAKLPALPAAYADPGARELLKERWHELGIRPAARGANLNLEITRLSESDPARAQAYSLTIETHRIRLVAFGSDGLFYAWATLAQLATRAPGGWSLPCARIVDRPALRWRVLSDDVSRGPLPTMRYFEERIRTIAGFKMNGYSPYMEHVFVDPKHPLPAPLDGITPDQLRELDSYARRFHVALIPEQQTFAHMHETLRWERYAPLAELPHGYLLTPADPAGEAYVRDLIADELSAVPDPPFFHIGSDEPSDLGRGRSAALVAAQGEGPLYTQHVVATANFVLAHSHARPMLWDDALSRHPELFSLLPKGLVFVNWHYGSESTYLPYIKRIAGGGFEQMVAPGALNWNEIYPDLDAALANIDRFVSEGKTANVLGLFQTVWHDDGETLYEATWYPVLYAAASAWERDSVPRERFARDFPAAFFGVDDAAYAGDLAKLGAVRTLLRASPREYGDYLFWSDPFDPALAGAGALDLRAIRLAAEDVIAHLRVAPDPPLHANAAEVMLLAARRYDALARNFQIASEARGYYADALANAGKNDAFTGRGL
ncbi:MAG TPA: glycoside hydrolase family 20 zincin-like fold domain-containing protein, partial [Candidatus Baltobacteraceae bacterium]|nr:glycoside hydrolase family 20 zincin-like fold domain-containing protein [Candidatus Baltobacteraceae bacterium]